MTIAIAATFPWGVLKAANSIPSLQHLRGVILITDSRWSYQDGSLEDLGGKLHRLAPRRGIGAVFSGDVYAAENGLNRAQRRLELAVGLDSVTVSNVVSGALREVYLAHKQKRPAVKSLSVLVGMIQPSGLPVIIRLSSSDDFVPHPEEDVQIIGSPPALKEFHYKLDESEAAFRAGNGEVLKLDIREGALRLVAELFASVIEPAIDRTVGGLIQLVTITQHEWIEAHAERLEGLETGASWNRVTVALDQVKRCMDDENNPPLAPHAEREKVAAGE